MNPERTPDQSEPVWRPSAARQKAARITDYTNWLEKTSGHRFDNYDALWQWSVSDLDGFWRSIWDYFDIRSPEPPDNVLGSRAMPGAEWFPGTRVNFVDQVFRHADASRPAILFADESGIVEEISWAELQNRVMALASFLRIRGVAPGDRVAAYLPNRPEAIIAFLASASIGAIWSMCSPDMGPVSVLDRFRQIAPKVLIAGNGYRYGGKTFDRRETIAELRRELPSLETFVIVPVLTGESNLTDVSEAQRNGYFWPDLVAGPAEFAFEWVPFDHPLWIVYSSGTTGTPKPIVHGHGGIMLAMSVTLALHNDLWPEDRYHWYSSTGWIMWNCQLGGLLVGSTVCIYDGNPGYPDLNALWRFAGATQATFFGAGAAFYASCLKAGIEPNEVADFSNLRSVGSTGSPLSEDCYEWIYRHVGSGDIWLSPMSGGTDLAGPFIAGNPTMPVYLGEMQCRVLGAAVYAYDDGGKAVIDEVGELVCSKPMPSMPIYFWNDPGNQRYLDSYYDTYPGVWRHGDWIRITPRGGSVIYGRSDATINRHGIRMGTSELYRAVEALPEILDCLVVDLEYLGRPSYMPLFVVLRPSIELNDELKEQINGRIRTALSARHVPNEIFTVPEVPRTLSGKKLELPIKKLLLGQPLDRVVNRDSMANPGSLAWFVDFATRRS
ncbi:acetoacetate--CoA ligase [Ferribacterium limneticum]|uniref:acetoacetate--CoA ligase n=1 Tax=Ferribacterium limneticum TaxID=76259 RepID=UPI001CF89999|nr:acetoacetate--CoA ligase [Ferribacterium limneticum]UCV24982.1 acetoacetate--CoA ligase [Ferribacterium limneticum]